MNLYEMNREIEQVLEALLASVDEETGEVDETIKSRLDELTEERETKLDNIGVFIKSLESEAEAINAEMKRLKKRMDSKQRLADRLRAYVTDSLLADGKKSFETSRVVYSFIRSEAVNITGAVPRKYMVKTVTEKPDKKAITQALKAGIRVRGAELVEKQNLQVK